MYGTVTNITQGVPSLKQGSLTEQLLEACYRGPSALRCEVRLLPPVEGAKVFPPTYAPPQGTQGSRYAEEPRYIDGELVNTVLLDSVPSQANRMEQALLAGARNGDIPLPLLQVEIPGHGGVTSLDAPHRVFDAIFRDSLLDGEPFLASAVGRALRGAGLRNATALFRYAPTTLLFGAWDSHTGRGVRGTRVPRAVVSEIIGIAALRGVKTQSRIDPLGIERDVADIYKTDLGDWDFSEGSLKEAVARAGLADRVKVKKSRPSEVGHGNVTPTVQEDSGGVSIRYALHTTVISLAQLRQLSFPDATGRTNPERDAAGRLVLVALALYATAALQEEGYQLRSRCLLVPESAPQWELVGPTAGERDAFTLDAAGARALLHEALETAGSYGLTWETDPVVLEPSPKLVRLVELNNLTMGA